MYELTIGSTEDYWIFASRLFFVSFSVRVDWNDYPGLSISFGLFDLQLGLSMMKYERKTAAAN